jgi:hypothetical protein
MMLPKPTREDRRRSKIDTSELMLSKEHPDRSGEYKAWIRTHRCILHWLSPCEHFDGKVEAAHMDKCGRGIKGSDLSCIPLCRRHHGALDTNTLDWQIVAFCWMKAWELLAEWHRRAA